MYETLAYAAGWLFPIFATVAVVILTVAFFQGKFKKEKFYVIDERVATRRSLRKGRF